MLNRAGVNLVLMSIRLDSLVTFYAFFAVFCLIGRQDLGGDSVGVLPLPIPNREVKPISAENTSLAGKIGRRRDLALQQDTL